jgi:hypothetical protein
VTENAAVFNDEQLRHFSVVVLNSASGGFLTPDQRAAFARFLSDVERRQARVRSGDGDVIHEGCCVSLL